jgi:hypothetical protein
MKTKPSEKTTPQKISDPVASAATNQTEEIPPGLELFAQMKDFSPMEVAGSGCFSLSAELLC